MSDRWNDDRLILGTSNERWMAQQPSHSGHFEWSDGWHYNRLSWPLAMTLRG